MKNKAPDKSGDKPARGGDDDRVAKGDSGMEDSLAALLNEGRKRTRVRRILVLVTASVLLAGGAVFFLKWKKVDEASKVPRYVEEKVTRGDLIASISATGTVEALNTVEVGAEISGRILSLHADFNDAVTEGQVLAVIDPEQLKAAVDQAKAQMLAADAQVAEAEATLVETKQDAARAVDLAAKGLYSSKDLESSKAKAVRAQAALKSAKASAAMAKASFTTARSKLGKTEILSPISGTVLSREVEVGQTINAGMQTPVLFVIAEDLRRMRLSSRVDEADIGNVREGQSAVFTVDAYPGRKFNSTVTSVRNVPQTEQNVVSYEVLLSVDNKELLLKPGMTASVEIVTEKHSNVLLVPNKALRFSPPRDDMGFFRRPPGMPFLGKAGGRRGGREGKQAERRAEGRGKPAADEGVLWMLDDKGGPGAIKPVKVRKVATDSIRTAVESERLKEGDSVIVEQAETEQAGP